MLIFEQALVSLLTFTLLVFHIKCNDEFDYLQIEYNDNGTLENIGNNSYPKSIDWRDYGVITDVFDEREFFNGYSWAFSAVEAVQSQVLLRNETVFKSLSAQSLIDCIVADNTTGLTNITFVFNYMLSNGVLPETVYPYKPGKDKCDRLTNVTKNAIYLDYFIKVVDELHLHKIVGTMGPVSALIDASQLKTHKSGIVDSKLCSNSREALTQAVQVVGYDSENNKDYWIVKNSWGYDWGEQGYLRIARNLNNTCGIALEAIYGGILNKTVSY